MKWNQINKIVLKISEVAQGSNMLLCAKDKRQLYIAIDANVNNEDYLHPSLNGFTADVTQKELIDREYHEVTFTFDTPIDNIEPANVWDLSWSKNIVYHEIAFYNGDELLADYVPYYKGAGYMLDKKNNVVIRATNPDDYEFV